MALAFTLILAYPSNAQENKPGGWMDNDFPVSDMDIKTYKKFLEGELPRIKDDKQAYRKGWEKLQAAQDAIDSRNDAIKQSQESYLDAVLTVDFKEDLIQSRRCKAIVINDNWAFMSSLCQPAKDTDLTISGTKITKFTAPYKNVKFVKNTGTDGIFIYAGNKTFAAAAKPMFLIQNDRASKKEENIKQGDTVMYKGDKREVKEICAGGVCKIEGQFNFGKTDHLGEPAFYKAPGGGEYFMGFFEDDAMFLNTSLYRPEIQPLKIDEKTLANILGDEFDRDMRLRFVYKSDAAEVK
jgi:hypothetical protein